MTIIIIPNEYDGAAAINTNFHRFNRDLCTIERKISNAAGKEKINNSAELCNYLQRIIDYYRGQ